MLFQPHPIPSPLAGRVGGEGLHPPGAVISTLSNATVACAGVVCWPSKPVYPCTPSPTLPRGRSSFTHSSTISPPTHSSVVGIGCTPSSYDTHSVSGSPFTAKRNVSPTASTRSRFRSEERRVGQETSSSWSSEHV